MTLKTRKAPISTCPFNMLVPGQHFVWLGKRCIKVSPKRAYPLNASGIAIPEQSIQLKSEDLCVLIK